MIYCYDCALNKMTSPSCCLMSPLHILPKTRREEDPHCWNLKPLSSPMGCFGVFFPFLGIYCRGFSGEEIDWTLLYLQAPCHPPWALQKKTPASGQRHRSEEAAHPVFLALGTGCSPGTAHLYQSLPHRQGWLRTPPKRYTLPGGSRRAAWTSSRTTARSGVSWGGSRCSQN